MSTMHKMLIRENKGTVRVASSLSSGESPDIDGFSSLINVRTVRFSPKDVIYHAGDQAEKIYEVRSGLVKLVTYMSNGRQRIVRLHGVNDCIGLSGLLRQSQEHTAVAVTSVEARFVQVGDYPLWNSHGGHHYWNLVEMLFGHLKKADIWIERFATGCIRSRVAHLVNYLSEVEYGPGSKKVMLLTCEEMAAILGATTESVSTALAEFKRSGALKLLGHAFEKQYELVPDLLVY